MGKGEECVELLPGARHCICITAFGITKLLRGRCPSSHIADEETETTLQ